MPNDLKSLREERGRLAQEARQIIDTAEKEKRSLTDEERTKFDAIHDKIADLKIDIDTEERQRELEREMAERAAEDEHRRSNDDPEDRANRPGDGDGAMTAFRSWLRTGTVLGPGAEEFRALQATADTEGGFLVAPEQFVQRLLKRVDDLLFIRGASEVFEVPTAASLGVPSLDADPDDADWTHELGTGNEDDAMSFGKRELHPHPLAKRIKVSNKLLRVSGLPIESIVMDRLAYKFAVTREKAYLTGDGHNKPLGIFTASDNGISKARDVSEDNKRAEITADGLISAKFSLKQQYWANATWMFHRDGVKRIAKLKDADGQYLWRESVREGEPDRLLGRPIWMSEFVPNTFAANQYVGALGDFSNYWIAEALDMQMQRLVELYAETNQIGFIGRQESDAMPALEEAFARVQLAS